MTVPVSAGIDAATAARKAQRLTHTLASNEASMNLPWSYHRYMLDVSQDMSEEQTIHGARQ